MAFSRLLSSSYHSFMSAVPAFIRHRPFATAAMSLVAISYATPRLIRYFNTNELNNNNNNDDDDDLVLWDFTETEESVILRSNLVADNVRKEEIDVCVDHGTLRIEDVLPGRNLFSVTLNLKGKHCDFVNTKAKMIENNFIEVVVPKLKNKEEDEDEDDDVIVHHVDVE
ncbi:hypothetical protein MtrunA17_Chr5g0412341 [Medicago truncatula]|uniref:SHSP domain-containing protein n=1 Tax=Medicago truncatula TaxID=3880 RepID=G7JXP3_MEDTR|nr:hypothetical protein MTR_5g032340 [Medicago truncatula]RHN54941.1 hypothetical protein MtrunA17_Chr5g0412341 [Medicago truncatula]